MAIAHRHQRPQQYPIEYIDPNPFQPRLEIDPDDLTGLIDSIRRYGFHTILQARPNPTDPGRRVQLVFGHRRLAAARAAGLPTVPLDIVAWSDQEMADQAFIENHTHKALSPWEEALFLRDYQARHRCSIRDLAAHLQASKGYLQNRLDLLRIPEPSPIYGPLTRNELDMTTAMTLHGLAQELPAAEIAALVSQVLAGTIANPELKRRKGASKSTPAAGTSRAMQPSRTDQVEPGAPSEPDSAEAPRITSEADGSTSLGRFAGLRLHDGERRTSRSPGASPIVPCGADDEARIAAGLLQEDGTDVAAQPAATQAAYRVLHAMKQFVPLAEQDLATADPVTLSQAARQEWDTLVERLALIVEELPARG